MSVVTEPAVSGAAPSPTTPELVLPTEFTKLSSLVENNIETLATGNKDIQLAALQATKYVFDLALQSESKSRAQIAELLASISPELAPRTRSSAAAGGNGKRKRSPTPEPITPSPGLEETPLSELTVEGMDDEQLWAQLELRAKNVCDILDYTLETTGELPESDDDESSPKKRKILLDLEDGLDEVDMDFDGMDDEDEEEDSDEDDSDDDEEEEEESEDDGEEEELGEDVAELRDPSDEEEVGLELDLDRPLSGRARKPTWKGKKAASELDDGFFNLAEFNAETEEAEARAVSKGKLGKDDDEEEDEEDEGVDWFASVDDGTVEQDLDGTQEIFYKDFYEPPAKPVKGKKTPPAPAKDKSTSKVRFHEEVRVKKIKAKGKNLPVSSMYSEEDEDDDDDDEYGDEDMAIDDDEDGDEEGADSDDDDMLSDGSEEDTDNDESESDDHEDEEFHGFDSRETIERLKDDLFADDDDDEKPDTGLSTHERRMASLRDEIAALEAENIEKKHWTLLGEATSKSRPQNALLEEDLEFEHVMKTVPVITEETVQGLEDRIKARIIEGRFDDVVRKRAVDDKPFLPSRFFELQDTKSKQSLAEIYEDEYVAKQTGGVAGEDRDGKLKKEHEEIEKLWENICSKLDALSNAHFTPKAPKATISTISNVAAASMESALPTSKSTNSMLAPEEIFAPSSSDLRAKSELAPTEKRALRNKQKKAKKKARDTLEKSVDKYAKARSVSGVKKQKEAALKTVVKTGKGVTVIGKKPETSSKSRKS
ncbi:U3 small nucleolar ribonucleoprotein MPP10 [Abortiporus biennis]